MHLSRKGKDHSSESLRESIARLNLSPTQNKMDCLKYNGPHQYMVFCPPLFLSLPLLLSSKFRISSEYLRFAAAVRLPEAGVRHESLRHLRSHAWRHYLRGPSAVRQQRNVRGNHPGHRASYQHCPHYCPNAPSMPLIAPCPQHCP